MRNCACDAGELANIARVPRRMILTHEDRDHPSAWIRGVPLDFKGYVAIDKPQYYVEVQTVLDEKSDSTEAVRFLVPIDEDITVAVREVLRTFLDYCMHFRATPTLLLAKCMPRNSGLADIRRDSQGIKLHPEPQKSCHYIYILDHNSHVP